MWLGMYLHLPEQVMHQYGYLQIISRPPSKSALLTVRRRDLDAIVEDFKNHLVPKQYRRVSAPVQWAYVDGYMACQLLYNGLMLTDTWHASIRCHALS